VCLEGAEPGRQFNLLSPAIDVMEQRMRGCVALDGEHPFQVSQRKPYEQDC
jgi:hypothetical protein